MRMRSLSLWAAALTTGLDLVAASALAREDYGDLFFVKPHGTAAGMFQDRAECRKVAQGLGGTSSSYSNPQYGAFNAMGSALDEDALHEGGLHKRMQIAILRDCMGKHGWTPLQPEGEDAAAVEHASLQHPQALDAWLKAHEPAADAKPAAVLATATSASAAAPAATPVSNNSPLRLYAVTFDVATDASGKITTMSVSKVTAPFTGTTDPVKLDVPGEFVDASRQQLLKRQFQPNQHFVTYSYYDPQRPNKGDIDPTDTRE
jgi:hypothetical protein